MKHSARVLSLMGLAVLLSAWPARATDNEYAKIMIHIVPVGSVGGNKCSSNKARPACQDMKVKGTVNEPYYAYVVATDGSPVSGLAGLEFGIDYNGVGRLGVDILEWSDCATLQFPTPGWPAPGSGNLITWDRDNACQKNEPGGGGTGVTAVGGYFYLNAYSPDKLEITVRPITGFAKVADCSAQEDIVHGQGVNFPRAHLGYVTFSDGATEEGYNPCGQARPVRDTTWSELKSNPNGN